MLFYDLELFGISDKAQSKGKAINLSSNVKELQSKEEYCSQKGRIYPFDTVHPTK